MLAEKKAKAPAEIAGQRQTNAERHLKAVHAVTSTYFPAIEALKLSPEKEQKLVQLLVDRAMAAWDAHDAVDAIQSRDPADYPVAIEYAQELVDREIDQEFGGQIGQQVGVMISAVSYIRMINQQYSPALSMAGMPMGDEQVLPLALVRYSSYGSDNNPNAEPRWDNVDEAGLTELDRVAVKRAASVLSPAQLDTLKVAIGNANRSYLKKTHHFTVGSPQ